MRKLIRLFPADISVGVDYSDVSSAYSVRTNLPVSLRARVNVDFGFLRIAHVLLPNVKSEPRPCVAQSLR